MIAADSTAAHDAALAFLWSRIDFERAASVPYHSLGFKLDRMRELLARLDNPQDKLKIVHIAGTKGKGSTAAMIAAILTAAGKRTGLFSSPHLDRVEERLAINGAACSAADLVALVEHLRPIAEQMDRAAATATPIDTGPTYFELTTAMALLHFVNNGVQAAVLEVGMGGRLDSTNVCTPAVSVITSISFDHTKQLGNTLAEIAGEKAGIIKPGVPVVSGVTNDEPKAVIDRVRRERGCRLIQLGQDFEFVYHPPRDLQTGEQAAAFDFISRKANSKEEHSLFDVKQNLLGRHQAANAAVALATIQELNRQGWQIGEGAIRPGLVRLNWPARVEIVHRQPTIILDVAHNVASVAALLEVLDESFSARRRTLVFATTKDKDVRGMLELLLPRFDEVIFTRYTRNPRGVPVEELNELAAALSVRPVVSCPDSLSAWNHVRERTAPGDLICITGSFFLAAEMREHMAEYPLPPVAKMAAANPVAENGVQHDIIERPVNT